MIKIITFIILGLDAIQTQLPSPCPDILEYQSRGFQDRWHAIITLKNRETIKGIWLRIILDRTANILGNDFGEVTSTDNRDFLIRNMSYTLMARSKLHVNIIITFNAASIVPSIVAITFNALLICKQHSRSFLDEDESNVDSDSSEEFFPGDFSPNAMKPHLEVPNSTEKMQNEECGIVASQPIPLISYGFSTFPGQWPWHAAIYHFKGIQIIYACGGTLISLNHILTAAHCVSKPHTKNPMDPEDLLISLGKYNLVKTGTEIQDREVEHIFIHPDYDRSFFYNDIAICKLLQRIQITSFVRPICLWNTDDKFQDIEGKLGTIVGWGFDQNRELSRILMMAEIPVVSFLQCLLSNRDFFSQYISLKSFCAGFTNGTAICAGDSGGGLVFSTKSSANSSLVWHLRGIASVGVSLNKQDCVDPTQYTLFVDVAQYLDWIKANMKD